MKKLFSSPLFIAIIVIAVGAFVAAYAYSALYEAPNYSFSKAGTKNITQAFIPVMF